jgi:acetolactate synthase-1/2/3 large subunit
MEDKVVAAEEEEEVTPGEEATTVAKLVVRCLENEGVKYVFGIPGEENIHFIDAPNVSSIGFILVHQEQAASFIAEMYGRVTGKAGVCSATLEARAINLLLGTADAYRDSVPLVAISAQTSLNRQYKETYQFVDLVGMFKPVTKWAAEIKVPSTVPEMVRKAFKVAQTERPGSCYLGILQHLEEMSVSLALQPLLPSQVYDSAPSPSQVSRAAP